MKLFYSFLFFFICSITHAQMPVSLELYKKIQDADDSEQIPVIVQGDENEIRAFLKELKKQPDFRIGKMMRTTVTKNDLKNAKDYNIRFSGGLKGQLLNDSVRVLNGAVPLHEGLYGLPQAYKGKGVVVGILDSGLDYRHPDFSDEDGNSRIHSIWDQRKTGAAPDGFDYGYLCDAASIADGTCPSFDEEWNDWRSHGTHVAGTAAGYDQQYDNKFTGMAPEATIIAVALDFENFGTSVVDGAKYIYDVADELGLPAVINLSAGTYSGPHDGKNEITYAVNELITEKPGRAFVAAAGNAGTVPLHAKHNVTNTPQFTYFAKRGSGENLRFEWFLYSDSPDFENVNFQLQADNKTTFAKVGESSVMNILADFDDPGDGVIEKNFQVFSETDDVIGDVSIAVEKFEGRYGLRVYIDNTSNQYYWRFSSWGSGMIDFYSHAALTRTSTMILASQLPEDFSELASYTSPDYFQNTVGYFSASRNTITVGVYASKTEYLNYNGDLFVDNQATLYDRLAGSSVGPNRDGYLKPDISSTGSRVASASNVDYIQWRLDNNQYLRSVTPDNEHFRLRGTSMASPSVAGGIALLLQAYPDLTWDEIRDAVIDNAVKDEFTGPTETPSWGHGKYNAFGPFEMDEVVCPTEDLVLRTQAEVDAFPSMYPGCSELDGGIVIRGNNIHDLSPLSQISKLKHLVIFKCPMLTNLSGLENITEVTNFMAIRYNYGLTSIAELSTSGATYGGLLITNNTLLSDCAIDAVCSHINTTKYKRIRANATGCNGVTEVRDNCVAIDEEGKLVELSVSPNPAVGEITVTGIQLKSQKPTIEVINSFGNKVIAKDAEWIKGGQITLNVADLEKGVYYIQVQDGNQFYKASFVKM